MNKKTLSIVLGAVLLASFFLPYFSMGGIMKISGFELITNKDMGGGKSSADKYVLLLVPIAGALLLAGALMGKEIVKKMILGILALLGVLYPLIRTMMEGGSEGMGMIFKLLGLGFWLGLIAAIVTIVYNPKD